MTFKTRIRWDATHVTTPAERCRTREEAIRNTEAFLRNRDMPADTPFEIIEEHGPVRPNPASEFYGANKWNGD